MNLEKVYSYLPCWLQSIAVCAEGCRIRRNRFGGAYQRLFETAIDRSFFSEESIREFRDSRLREFVRHAYNTSPYYNRLLDAQQIHPNEINGLADLSHLPILTKRQAQDEHFSLLSNAVPVQKRIIEHTSGTTGAGLRFATTREALQEQWAVWSRYRSWHGLQLGTWCAYFGGRSVIPTEQSSPPFWRCNYPGKQILFSGYHMSPTNLNHYISQLRRKAPPWIHGFPSLIALLASHILERKVDIGYQVRWVTTGSENLLPQQAELITRAFGVKPRQHYGLEEAVANVSECELGNLHVDEDFAAVEFIKQENSDGYRIVGTNFTNPAFPLIRYDSNDIVTLSEKKCSCGRPGRIVQTLDGRLQDYVLLRNGARIGVMDLVFTKSVNIREAQFYQREPGVLILRVVRGPHYKQTDEELLLAECFKRVGPETTVSIKYVDDLERSSTGKLRLVISDIPEAKRDSLNV